jgi:4-amino-4-deoxy-L-arabinose transferase-like glycosyltransferase
MDKRFSIWLLLIVAVAVALRLWGIHDPLLDHPAWRQGDTASIARNFARLQFNIMYPQTNYDGPPPNYVELELQIVPFLAASMYKIFGVHEIFGRLITLAFSIATVAVIAYFGRWLFASALAGLSGACFFAIFPGSIYYGRTFMPDTAMVFFLTAALYVTTRLIVEDEVFNQRSLARSTALLTLAYLAKPVAVAGIIPVAGALWERVKSGRTMRPTAIAVLLVVPLIILWLYDARVAQQAEWHWASGITTLHVIPALKSAFTSPSGFLLKLQQFREALGMLRATMLGSIGFVLAIAGFIALPWIEARSKALLWGWLISGLVYTYIVVTVERVDYYMYLLLPLCALVIGAGIMRFVEWIGGVDAAPAARYALIGLVPLIAVVAAVQARAAVAPYYEYSRQTYRNAVALDRTLSPGALVVVGHYGPDVLYYIDRYGWEEDPRLWTPFDEESAIRKGARYFISIEDNRLRSNLELCAWLQRFPVLNERAQWPVYVTDPLQERPGADAFWRAFRRAEFAGGGRAFLDAHGVCMLRSASAWSISVKTKRARSNASGPTRIAPRNGKSRLSVRKTTSPISKASVPIMAVCIVVCRKPKRYVNAMVMNPPTNTTHHMIPLRPLESSANRASRSSNASSIAPTIKGYSACSCALIGLTARTSRARRSDFCRVGDGDTPAPSAGHPMVISSST